MLSGVGDSAELAAHDIAVKVPLLGDCHISNARRNVVLQVLAYEQMICGNTIFEIEQVEKLTLIALVPPHHTRLHRRTNQTTENHAARMITSLFQQYRS
jgi:hypothetical protein